MAGLLFFALHFSGPAFGLPIGPGLVKPFHLLALLLLLPFLLGVRTQFPRVPLSVGSFFFWAFGVSLLLGLASGLGLLPEAAGLNPLLLNYAFAFYLFLLGLFFAGGQVLSGLRIAALAVLALVFLKNYFFADALRAYLASPEAHPELPWLFGGGPNLEASWLVIGGALFLGTPLFWPYWFLAVGIAALYASRAALALALALAGFAVLASRYRLVALVALGLAAVLGLGLVLWLNPYVLARFTQIGEDPGSLGRLDLWASAWQAFLAWPLGYGAGNAIHAANLYAFSPRPEDNVHNYYLQVLLDFGLVGLLAWFGVLFAWLRRFRGDPLGTYLGLYFVGALVQFRGADPLFWFVLGLYLGGRGGGASGRAARTGP